MRKYSKTTCDAGKLQKEANRLGIGALAKVAPAQAAAAKVVYIETLQSANQIPYPLHGALPPKPCTCWRHISSERHASQSRLRWVARVP